MRRDYAALAGTVLLIALMWWFLPQREERDVGITPENPQSRSLWQSGPAVESVVLPDATASLQGRVVHAIDRTPIPGAVVSLRAPGGIVFEERISGTDGSFTFATVAPEIRYIAVEAQGYALLSEPVQNVNGRRNAPMRVGRVFELGLDRAVHLSGRVVDQRGDPIPDATVWVEDRARRGHSSLAVSSKVQSDADGRFTIEDGPTGRLFAWATAHGHAPGDAEVPSSGAGRRHENIEIALEDGAMLSGRVVDQRRVPVIGARVVFVNGEREQRGFGLVDQSTPASVPAVTGADGAFAFDSLPVGLGTLGAASETGTGALGVYVDPNGTVVDVVLVENGMVGGRVIDSDGHPLSGVRVSLSTQQDGPDFEELDARAAARGPSSRTVLTDVEGRFRLDGLLEETVRVVASCEGFTEARKILRVGDTDSEMQLGGEDLVVTVVTAEGIPFGGDAYLIAIQEKTPDHPWRESVSVFPRVGTDGSFRFTLTPNTWDIRLKANGFADPPSTRITAVEGQTPAPLTIRLGKQGVVRGTLIGSGETRIAGARLSLNEVNLIRPDWFARFNITTESESLDWHDAVRSRADGTFELTAGAGKGRLFIHHAEYTSEVLSVVVPESGVVDVGQVRMGPGDGLETVSVPLGY